MRNLLELLYCASSLSSCRFCCFGCSTGSDFASCLTIGTFLTDNIIAIYKSGTFHNLNEIVLIHFWLSCPTAIPYNFIGLLFGQLATQLTGFLNQTFVCHYSIAGRKLFEQFFIFFAGEASQISLIVGKENFNEVLNFYESWFFLPNGFQKIQVHAR